jgi:membrane-associated phospholipid phosphatase
MQNNLFKFIDSFPFLAAQEKLKTDNAFQIFWQFWSNYSFVFFLPLGVLILQDQNHPTYIAFGLAAMILSRGVFAKLINYFIKRKRPYQALNFEPHTSVFLSQKTADPNSFPSRHMLTYASVAAFTFVVSPVQCIILLAVTAMTGAARVVMGFHYPSDVIAGYVIGVILGLFFAVLAGSSIVFTF